jgi:hypothetical protein
MKRTEIEANARKPYADAIVRISAERDELVEALRECITEDGAACLKQSPCSATNLRRRIAAINEIARAILAKIEG